MANALVGIGTVANDGTGDPLRTAFQVLNGALGYVYVANFGAKGDGVTDDTSAIQAAENSRTAGQVLKFAPGKTYILAATTIGTLLRTHTSGAWDLSGATLQYGGATNLVLGADSAELGLVNVLNGPFMIGGAGAVLDGNSKVATPLAVLHTVSGVGLGPLHLTIKNCLEGQSSSAWTGIAYRMSSDISGVTVTSARASNIHGHLVRPSCPFSNASDALQTHGDVTAEIYGGSVSEVIGTNAVRSCTGFAYVAGGVTSTGNYNVQPQRLGSNGVIVGQAGSGGGAGQPVLMDEIVHDIGPSTQELYGQFLPVANILTWGAGTIAVSAAYSVQFLAASSNVAVTIGAPSAPPTVNRAMPMRFIVQNTTGATLTTPIVFAAGAGGYQAGGPLFLRAGQYAVVDFVYYQPNNVWIESNRQLVPGVIFSDPSAVTVGGTPTGALETIQLPANTLSAIGAGLRLKVGGFCNNNANAKSVQILLGGTPLVNMALTINVADQWSIEWNVYARSLASGTQPCNILAAHGPTNGAAAVQLANMAGTSFDPTGSSTLVVQATQAAGGDITQTSCLLEYV